MWAWAAPLIRELIAKPYYALGVISGVVLAFSIMRAGFVTTPQITKLAVKIAVLEADVSSQREKIAELEATCVPFVLE